MARQDFQYGLAAQMNTSPHADDSSAADTLADALASCAAGDRAGLKVIFDAEAGRLVGMAQRILRRRDLAEEVVQEAFVIIWEKAGQYAGDRGSPRGWIYTIVRNRALNVIRDGAREDLVDASDLEQVHDLSGAADDAWRDLASESQLKQCLEALDEPKRQSILLAYINGFTHGEVAGQLKVPLGTAKSWIKRGLSMLRECLS
tara:strand:+ start:539 stop:1147 length:609 start_codon:yes stop_codon:yes gene_type:complete